MGNRNKNEEIVDTFVTILYLLRFNNLRSPNWYPVLLSLQTGSQNPPVLSEGWYPYPVNTLLGPSYRLLSPENILKKYVPLYYI